MCISPATGYGSAREHRDVAEVRRIVDQLVGTAVYLAHPTMPAARSGARAIGRIERVARWRATRPHA